MLKISSKLYAETLYEICQEAKDVDSAVRGFIDVLSRHNKLSLVKKIIGDFVRFYNKKTNTVDVDIETPFKLEESDYEPIIDLAKSLVLAKNAGVNQMINSDLIGGAIINIDDWQIDLSIKNKLRKLNN